MKPAYGMKDFRVIFFTAKGEIDIMNFTARNEKECITNFMANFKGFDIIDIQEDC